MLGTFMCSLQVWDLAFLQGLHTSSTTTSSRSHIRSSAPCYCYCHHRQRIIVKVEWQVHCRTWRPIFAPAIIQLCGSYADISAASGEIRKLHKWWDKILAILQMHPDYGYYANPSKTWLIVKEDAYEKAMQALSAPPM